MQRKLRGEREGGKVGTHRCGDDVMDFIAVHQTDTQLIPPNPQSQLPLQ